MTDRKTKDKRSIPLRSPGETVNPQATRPSQLLFDEVKRLEDLEVEKPNNEKLGTQIENFGYPTIENLGTLVPKNEIRVPKSMGDLGTKVPKNKKLGTQKYEKVKNYQKYEKARSTISVHVRADEAIFKKIQHFLVENKKEFPTMKEFFEMSAGLLIDTFGYPNNKSLGTLVPHDDRRMKMLYKSRDFIINLYLAYNSIFNELSAAKGKAIWAARWSPRDDEAAYRYNEISPVVIELGILQTQIQKGFGTSRIQTFKYYTDEIEKVLTSGVSDEMLTTILEYHRTIWTNQTKRKVDLEFLKKQD